MRHGTASDYGVVKDTDMTSEAYTICDHGIVADNGIVAEVRVCHDVVVVANCCWRIAGCAVNGNTFTDNVVVADEYACPVGVRVEFAVLRGEAEAGEGVNCVIGAYDYGATNINVLNEVSMWRYGDVASYYAKWADGDVVSDLGVLVDNRGRVYIRHSQI